ncbi:N-acetylglucosamine kinase [Phytoactinopolyspora endophytica]|uniref:N-acetylglucosamine kinase n=1 Tax=Phytoactinopolyspora endophytica TaxID=1642495 RepID=UPI00101D3F7E|nr:BadF/BadG/BcrA/BcrD ATPase family protein [Phytoactinopolyspora endophytica]
MTKTTFISIDGGKSQLRLLAASEERREYGVGPGMIYQPDEDGVDRILDSVRTAAEMITRPKHVAGVVAGLTGLPGDANLRQEVAAGLTAMFQGPVLIVEDVVLAHAGALNGPGTVLCAGTGTNVHTIGKSGGQTRLDGWGPLLGDRGSGYAIGLAGLRASIASLDGVGPRTVLAESLADAIDGTDLASLQRFYRDPYVVGRIAGFAQTVLSAAPDDTVARAICDEAVRDLAIAAQTAAGRLSDAGPRVSYSGRLIAADGFLSSRLRDELRARGLELTDPIASPLEGGVILLQRDEPYAALLTQAWRESSLWETGDLG